MSRRFEEESVSVLVQNAADLGGGDPFDPSANIDAGARFPRSPVVRYDGDVELALAAYHADPTTVDSHGSVPPYPTTHSYISNILSIAGIE